MRVYPSNLAILVSFILLISCFSVFSDDVSRGQGPYYSVPMYIPPTQLSPDYAPPTSAPPVAPPKPHSPVAKPTVAIVDDGIPLFLMPLRRCVRPGDIVNFKGIHLSKLDNYELIIHVNENEIKLIRLHSSDSELSVRIPDDMALEKNKSYKVILISKIKETQYFPLELSIRVCFSYDEQSTISIGYETGEVLVLVNDESITALKQKALSLKFELIKEQPLKSFGETMLLLKTSESNLRSLVKVLRNKFPDATIDLNARYHQADSKARIYATQMITWRTCGNKSYEELAIGIIDGWPDLSHPALVNQNIIVKNFLAKEHHADRQHGTAIATLITGNQPEAGFEGILPNVKIMAAIALRQEGNELLATAESIIRSINWLILNNIRLINISLSGGNENLVLTKVIAIAIQRKTIIFAAAGNDGRAAEKSYPAALPGVIAITAIDAASRIYEQANQGKYIDFSAPGVDIWVPRIGGIGKYGSGTSYATPYALAVAGLYLTRNPSLSPSLLYAAMKNNSTDIGTAGRDPIFGWGLVRFPAIICK